ncbi:hypothetical protein M427DRAFT_53705 [Gonapodya prolifera JEL478]|uniref:NOT2/NOT3/NOT5 C-terminal domain-containing protein n=1 Tax=Gonapodya prolifera (strain JEL478) TaxID=1344416 RepID=A0A139ANI8_GONPJ|nr:hypothetical protein M427DRAFT_53705 [Gonapodya prolifera JEL478]|eukprot:KXS18309.1 hypothetical protein M427DRAFT_53705 [Gonapodya prolifera JEL478]
MGPPGAVPPGGIPPPGSVASPGVGVSQDRYGLHGLLDVIRGTDPDQSALALGSDLTTLGLDLNSDGPLWSTFVSPFAPVPTTRPDPVFTLPPCYNLPTPPPPALTKLHDFSDETLLYAFYAMPRDAMAEAAAQELHARSWRFHKESRVWLARDADAAQPGGAQQRPPGVGPGGAAVDKAAYWIWELAKWERERRDMVVRYEDLEDRSNGVGAPAGAGMGLAGAAGIAGMAMGMPGGGGMSMLPGAGGALPGIAGLLGPGGQQANGVPAADGVGANPGAGGVRPGAGGGAGAAAAALMQSFGVGGGVAQGGLQQVMMQQMQSGAGVGGVSGVGMGMGGVGQGQGLAGLFAGQRFGGSG